MITRLHSGWLVTGYDGHDLARVYLATGDREPGDWVPAFLDYDDGQRIAKIRLPGACPARAWMKVNGAVTPLGKITG